MKKTLHTRPANWSVLFIILLALGGLLRLRNVNDPPLDFHSTRQLRDVLVARDIYYSRLPSATTEQRELAASFAGSVGKYEPPVIESLVAYTYFLTGGENIASARVWETLFWLAAGVALFDLMRRAVSPWAAVIGWVYYLFLPFSVQASRSFQPDPLMTAAFVLGIYFLSRWSETTDGGSKKETWKWALLAGGFLGFAVFVKIVIAFFAGSAAVALVLFTLKKDFWRSKQVWAMAVLMIVPALFFYVLQNHGRSTEYFFSWSVSLFKLIASINFYARWLSFIGNLFGLTMIFLSILGVFLATPRLRWLLISLWIGYVLYGLTLPFQMFSHTYYHIQLIPIIALGLAAALSPLLESAAIQSAVGRAGFVSVFVVAIVSMIGFQSFISRSVLDAEKIRQEPLFWEQIGKAIPADVDVIGLTQDYGFRLMVYSWRKIKLWPYVTELAEVRNGREDFAKSFNKLTSDSKYFLVTDFDQLNKQPSLKKILDTYPIAMQGEGYVLYDLRK